MLSALTRGMLKILLARYTVVRFTVGKLQNFSWCGEERDHYHRLWDLFYFCRMRHDGVVHDSKTVTLWRNHPTTFSVKLQNVQVHYAFLA